MTQLHFIIWNADPEIFNLFGRSIRWYGLLFALGFLISQQIMYYIHKKEGKPIEDVDTLTVFLVIATIIGARLGHVFFYEPMRYLQHPIEILKIWEGGLASHGAAVGILVAIFIYSRYRIKWVKTKFSVKRINREHQSFLEVVDRIVIAVAITGCLVRFGNFMNSEIVGLPSHSNTGVVFARNVTEAIILNNPDVEKVEYSKRSGERTDQGYVPIRMDLIIKNKNDENQKEDLILYLDNTLNNILGTYSYVTENVYEPVSHNLDYNLRKRPDGKFVASIDTFGIPRYPAQLFESLSSLLIGLFLFFLWNKWKINAVPGRLFGLFLVILFGLRFLYEFIKENQVDFENRLSLNMGQWLSIPLVLAGIYLIIKTSNKKKE